MINLIALHGFLGDQRDFEALKKRLPNKVQLHAINHFYTPNVANIGEYSEYHYQQNLADLAKLDNKLLLGYSLGARMAMHWLLNHQEEFIGAIYLAGHGGLAEEDQAARVKWRQGWVMRFYHEPLIDVLTSWYQQPIFIDDSCTPQIRAHRVAGKFKHQPPQTLGQWLAQTCLSNQQDLITPLSTPAKPQGYWVGSKDQKYCEYAENLTQQVSQNSLYQNDQWQFHQFSQSAHNCLSGNEDALCQQIQHFIGARL